MHRRYRGEAIRQLIERVHPENAEVFETLQLIRHCLMHGRRIASVLDQLPCDGHQALNRLAVVAWRAIGLMFGNPDPRPESPLTLGYCDDLVRRTLVAGGTCRYHPATRRSQQSAARRFPNLQLGGKSRAFVEPAQPRRTKIGIFGGGS